MLASRYTRFVDTLLSSCKPEVALLANLSIKDNRTVMGKTMSRLRKEIGSENLTPNAVKRGLREGLKKN